MKQRKNKTSRNPWKTAVFCLIFMTVFPAFALSGENYKFERMWPAFEQPWYFNCPAGVAVDEKEFVYIADSQNDQIQKFTSDGQFVTKWGKEGGGNGEFYKPHGVTVDNDGFVYVTNFPNSKEQKKSSIQKFTSDGQFNAKWEAPDDSNVKFRGIAASILGYIYAVDTKNKAVYKFDRSGEYILKWDHADELANRFNRPYRIATDGNGYVYVADSDCILKFNPDGQFIAEWESQENEYMGIAVDNKGLIYATAYNNRIFNFDAEGQFISSWRSYDSGEGYLKKSLQSIAVSNNGYIYVADFTNNRVQKFTKYGHFLSIWGTSNEAGELNSPEGLAIDKNGFVYAADTKNHRIQKFSYEGQVANQWKGYGAEPENFDLPYGIAVSNDGFVYVSDNKDRIQKLTTEGEFISQWGTHGTGEGEFDMPGSIAVCPDNEIYVADAGNHRIQRFTANGEFLYKWGNKGSGEGEFNTPYGIAIAHNGEIYVADTKNNRIQKFAPDGKFITKWEDSEAGKFNIPKSVTVDHAGFVYVTDKNNHRILKFKPDGEFITKWGEEGSYLGQLKFPGAGAVDQNGLFYIADNYNHRIQVFRKVDLSSNNKAIIVAGGGPFPGNRLWSPTQMCANFAYRTLSYQGFDKSSIYYLSSDKSLDLDSNGKADDIYANASRNSLDEVIAKCTGADNVILYLVDHGGDKVFRMNESEVLPVSHLKSQLDMLKHNISGKVIVIYDACQSGSFLSELADTERIIITSTSPDENAYFIFQGSISFSDFFWSHIFNGYDIREAFEYTKKAIAEVTHFQNPLLDANGNGQWNETNDYASVQGVFIGNGTDRSKDNPKITQHTPDKIISSITEATWYARVKDDDRIVRVWAAISPPIRESSDTPVLKIPSADMTLAENDQCGLETGEGDCYKGTYGGFNMQGTWQIAIYARDRKGNTSSPELFTISVEVPLRRKAIIAAGDSSRQQDTIDKQAGNAYNVLKSQGYADDDIYLMCSKNFSLAACDGKATLTNLRDDAIERWAGQDTQDIVIYLVGEGKQEAFQISNEETVSANALDAWLDTLQENMPGKVTVICDTDYSGSFLPLLMPPENKERIFISGAANDQLALFLSQGSISFSNFFWNGVSDGLSVQEAFSNAKDAVRFFAEHNTPQLDDNGNGIGNERSDGRLAMYYTIGMSIRLADNSPVVGSVSLAEGKTSADILAEDVTTTAQGIKKVWAVISGPRYDSDDSDQYPGSNQDLVTVELKPEADGRYKGTYNNFSAFGIYHVAVYAMDTADKISLSKRISVFQPAGPDIYEPDDKPEQAGFIVINDEIPQRRNLYDAYDEDWLKFYGLSDTIYTIRACRPDTDCTGINNLMIELYDSELNLSGSDENELSKTLNQNGVCYVRISHKDPTVVPAESTVYDLTVWQPTALFPGYIKGTITDAVSDKPVKGALIKTDANASFTSLDNGSYLMIHKAGKFTATAEAPGYESKSYSNLSVSEGGTTIMNFKLTPSDENSDSNGLKPVFPLVPRYNDDADGAACFIITVTPN